MNTNPLLPGDDTKLEQARSRTEQAESRTEQARTRTEQAETRTEQAESRTEDAKTRTEQAKTRTEQAEFRTEQAETRSDQAIRSSELSYRRLFEAAMEGILILEASTGRISDVNPFLMEMLGVSHDELVGRAIWELGAFKDIVANKARFEQLQLQGYALYDNLPMETRDGRRIVVEFVTNVYQAGDKKVLQCNIRDITERKNAEVERSRFHAELEQRVIERTAELQAANDQLEAFSYSVSHDLRAPLRQVLGFADMLQSQAGSSLSEDNLLLLTTICKVTKRMQHLVDDLLAFSHNGQSGIEKSEVNLDELVNETVSDAQADTKDRNILWETHPLPAVYADRALLRLVLVNLISNAIKFTRVKAEAEIEIGCSSNGDDETVIFIRDNGVGFDPAEAGRLFGVFQRLHRQDEFEGSGIGLAHVRRIIQRHGGRTWAEGEVGRGATFYFSVPKKSLVL